MSVWLVPQSPLALFKTFCSSFQSFETVVFAFQDIWNVIDLIILSFDLTRLGTFGYGTEKNVRMMLSTRAVRIITLTPEMRNPCCVCAQDNASDCQRLWPW